MRKKKPAKKEPSSPRRGGSGKRINFKAVLALMRTFSVRHFYVDVDTDNYVVNAQLIPVFTLLSGENVHLQTNFRGKSNVWIEIENRLIRIIRVAAKYKFKITHKRKSE